MGTAFPQPIPGEEEQGYQSGSPTMNHMGCPGKGGWQQHPNQSGFLLGMTGKHAEQASTREEFHACLIITAFCLNWWCGKHLIHIDSNLWYCITHFFKNKKLLESYKYNIERRQTQKRKRTVWFHLYIALEIRGVIREERGMKKHPGVMFCFLIYAHESTHFIGANAPSWRYMIYVVLEMYVLLQLKG